MPAATIPTDKQFCHWQIKAMDEQFDALVYELHGLTEEVAVVEPTSHP